MKYFNEHRRRLVKEHSIINKRATVSCDGSKLLLPSTENTFLERVTIAGNTIHNGTPTSIEPLAIQNVGDELETIIKGYNLFNEELLLESPYVVKSDAGYEFQYYPVQFNSSSDILIHLKNTLKAGVDYTFISKKTSIGNAAAGGIYLRNNSSSILSFGAGYNRLSFVNFNFTQSEIDSLASIWIYGTSESQFNNGANKTFFEYIYLVEGKYSENELPEYQPYFEPQSVTVPVTLCGIDDYKDKLTVDLVNKTVTKHSAIELYTFTGDESISQEESGENKAYIVDLPSRKAPETKYYCTHFSVYDGNHTVFEDIVEIIDNKAWFYNPTVDLVALLKTGEVQIAYVKNYPDSENVTDTARELFKLTTPYRQDAVLEVEGASSIEATYYSYENEDKLTLTVHYKSEDKRSLKDSNTYSIREGSCYTVIAPEIDGYEPLQTEYEGHLTKDDEITITYKEKK